MGRKERREQKRKQRNLIISLFFIFLMVFGFSLAGVIVNNPTGGTGDNQDLTGSLKYGDYKFEIVNNYYVADIDGRERRFNFFPSDTAGLRVPDEAVMDLSQAPVIIVTFDPYSPGVQGAELSRFQLTNQLDKTIYSAVTQNSTQYQYPVIHCQNATTSSPIIFLNSSNRTSYDYNNGCLTINGRAGDIVRATERLMYEMMGVIE